MGTKTEQNRIQLAEHDTVTFAVDGAGGRIFQDEQGHTFITAQVASDWQILTTPERASEN